MATANNIVHGVTLSFGAILIWLARPGSSLFSYHPALMTLGLMVFVLEGVLLMKDKRVPAQYKITVHWICSLTGVVLAILGFLAIYVNKENNGAGHFLTWHGLIGIITLLHLSVQTLGGLPAKYAVAVSKILKIKPKLIKQGHGLSGIIASNGIFVTVILSLYSNWFQAAIHESAMIWWFTLGLVIYPRLYLVVSFFAKEKPSKA